MNFKKQVYILAVVESLQANGSWTGKTHVNKALSLLRDYAKVDVPFNFVLYKHGPYSFDIEAELEQMQSYGALTVDPDAQGFGVTLQTGEMADFVHENAELPAATVKAIENVCSFVGSRNVAELERLATASWIRTREGISEPKQVAKRLNRLKPHVSLEEAEQAYSEISTWLTS